MLRAVEDSFLHTGDVTLDDGDGPIVLASAGIGCTPSASILRSLAHARSDREVLVLHADRSLDAWALSGQMLGDIERIDDAELHLWLEEPVDAPVDGAAAARAGFMRLTDVPLPEDASLYLCGALPFMQKIRSEAIALGVPARKIRYEVFGPDLWLAPSN